MPNPEGRPLTPLFDRFSAKYKLNDETGCWDWIGGKRAGYGRIGSGGARGTILSAHRLSYEIHVGPIQDGLVLDHLCRNRACVNPKHLEPVSNRVNILRGQSVAALNSRKTSCSRGHPLADENLFKQANGARGCVECRRIIARATARRRRARMRDEN
jgi:hypothetical protein